MSLVKKTTAQRSVRYVRKVVVSLVLAAIAATVGTLSWPPERIGSDQLQTLVSAPQAAETLGYDSLLASQGRRQDRIDPRIVVLGFERSDEQDLHVTWPAKHTTWPIDREIHAKVIRNLVKDGAALIAYDVLFSGPSTAAADKALDKALKEAGNVVLTTRIDRGSGGITRKSSEFPYYDDELGIDFEAHAHVGFAEIPQTASDSIVRGVEPLISLQGELYPSFPVAAFLALHKLDNASLAMDISRVDVGPLSIPVSYNGRDPFDLTNIPVTRVDYPAGAGAFPSLATFSQVANGEFTKGAFRGKIVFVGLTGPQITKQEGEHYQTSYSRYRPEILARLNDKDGGPAESLGSVKTSEVPGVVLQALHFNALLTKGFIIEAPASTTWILGFTMTFIAITLVRRFSNIWGLALILVCGFAMFGIAWLVLRYGHMHMPWIVPIISTCASAAGVGWLESGTIKRKWAGYVSPAVLDQILKGDEDLGARRYEASVMFGDIRGFTSFSEKHSPEHVVDVLNLHLEKLTKIISDEHGTIDKFLGDGILACFGAPIAFENSAVSAVRAAWKMREAAMEPVRDSSGDSHVLATGFGITTGPFLAGDIGSKQLKNWTVIGDVVNLASRLQGVTGEPDVIIDSETYRLVRAHAIVEPLGAVTLKGKAQPVECFKVVQWSDKPIQEGTLDRSNSNAVVTG